jgi:hypothetical protein
MGAAMDIATRVVELTPLWDNSLARALSCTCRATVGLFECFLAAHGIEHTRRCDTIAPGRRYHGTITVVMSNLECKLLLSGIRAWVQRPMKTINLRRAIECIYAYGEPIRVSLITGWVDLRTIWYACHSCQGTSPLTACLVDRHINQYIWYTIEYRCVNVYLFIGNKVYHFWLFQYMGRGTWTEKRRSSIVLGRIESLIALYRGDFGAPEDLMAPYLREAAIMLDRS